MIRCNKERQKREQRTRRRAPTSCSSSADAIKPGVGRNSGCCLPSAPNSPASTLLSSPLSLPLRRRTLRVFPSRNQPSHVCGGEEVQHLLGLPLGACLGDMLPGLRPVRTPPALSGGRTPRPVQALPSEAAPSLQPVKSRGEPLGAARYRSVRPLRGWYLVFLLGAQRLVSAHFFCEIGTL